MKAVFHKVGRIASKTPVLVVVLAAFGLGYVFRGAVSGSAPATNAEAVQDAAPTEEIWTCSMHPEVRLPRPGKCPKCGMDLILAKSSPAAPKESKDKKYACAMFCVPPMPNPGKCPICGMEMVEVETDEGSGDDAGPRTLTLSPAAQKLAEIVVAPVERKFVEAEIRMVGKIDYDETRLKNITAWVPGRLDRLFVDYTGVPVREGDHMVYMYSPELRIAQVELVEAIRTSRELQSSADPSIRESALDLIEDARTKLRLWGLNQEQIAAIEERGKPTDHMTIYAPIGGIVIHKNANEGMYVNEGTRIYTIADLSRLWVRLDAYESDLAWLRYGQDVEFEAEAYPGEKFVGTVSFIDPVLDARTRTVKVRVNVDNADGRLKPEMFVRAVARARLAENGMIVNAELAGKWISPMHPEVIKDEPGNCDVCGMPLVRAEALGIVGPDDVDAQPPLVVPAAAPLITGKRAVVYVARSDEPGTYDGREITLGPRAGQYYLVRDGLVEDEQVVVNGNFKIDSAIQIRAQPSMMNPSGGGPAPAHHHGGEQADPHADHSPEGSHTPEEGASGGAAIAVPGRFVTQLKPVFTAYFQVQQSLSKDSLKDAQASAKELAKLLDGVDMALLTGAAHSAWMTESKGLKKTNAELVAAPNIEKARAAFAPMSETMIAIAKRLGSGGEPVHRFHCPMAFNDRGANWLQPQDETQTANPYFGSAMFRCGVLKETIGEHATDNSEGGDGER